MGDRSHLHWPFFTPMHEGFAASLRSWLADRAPIETAEDEAVKRWVRDLASEGFLNACIDLDVRRLCLAREALAYHDALADFAFAMQGLGSGPITLFGTPEQRDRFLPGVTSGKTIMAFALSEREAGSDVAAIAARAVREGEEYVLNS